MGERVMGFTQEARELSFSADCLCGKVSLAEIVPPHHTVTDGLFSSLDVLVWLSGEHLEWTCQSCERSVRVFSVSMCSLIASCKLSMCSKSQTIAEVWRWSHTNCDQYFLQLLHLMEQGHATWVHPDYPL